MYLDHVMARLASVPYYRDTLVPCTIDEVLALEQRLVFSFPQAYREFLLWMGHAGGGFLRGSDCFYHDLLSIQEWARALLEEDHFPGTLPEQAFVFFMHQGYQFNFFLLHEGEDPPVYMYLEEDPVRSSFSFLYPSFSEFLRVELEGHIQIEATLRKISQ